MAEHTPGPWEAWMPQTHVAGEERTWSVKGPPSDFMFLREEADARLIAAAPELLEACKLLEDADTRHVNCQDCGGQGVGEVCGNCFIFFDAARLARRAAIAKAEGGSR